jgi:hypothetical protein
MVTFGKGLNMNETKMLETLEAMMQTIEELRDSLVDLGNQHEEIIEKLNNISAGGDGFSVETYP